MNERIENITSLDRYNYTLRKTRLTFTIFFSSLSNSYVFLKYDNYSASCNLLILAAVTGIETWGNVVSAEIQSKKIPNLRKKITWAEEHLAIPERDIDQKLNLAWSLVDKYKLK